MTMDNRNIYIGTNDCKIIKYCMDEIESEALKSIKAHKIAQINGVYWAVSTINDAFAEGDMSEEKSTEKEDLCEIIKFKRSIKLIRADKRGVYSGKVTLAPKEGACVKQFQ